MKCIYCNHGLLYPDGVLRCDAEKEPGDCGLFSKGHYRLYKIEPQIAQKPRKVTRKKR